MTPVIMDMPGVDLNDITIDLEESELNIRGASTYMEASSNLRSLHTEFGAQQYERSFTLSDLVTTTMLKRI